MTTARAVLFSSWVGPCSRWILAEPPTTSGEGRQVLRIFKGKETALLCSDAVRSDASSVCDKGYKAMLFQEVAAELARSLDLPCTLPALIDGVLGRIRFASILEVT